MDIGVLKGWGEVKLTLYTREPFLASVLYLLEVIPTEQEIVACTDGERLWIGIEVWNSISHKERLGVLLHELCHVIYLHPFLFKYAINDGVLNGNVIWNLVGDVIINKLLQSHGYVIIKGAICEFEQIDRNCKDLDKEDVREHSIIFFYEEVLKRLPKTNVIGCGPMHLGNGKQKEIDKGNEEDLRSYGCVKPNLNEEAKNRKQGEIKSLWEVHKSSGEIPGDYAIIVGNYEKTETPWRDLLKKWMTITQEEDYTFHRPKQYDKIILPRCNRLYEDKLDLVLVVDSSGSIDDDILYKFACEVFTILSTVGRRIYLIVTDADVKLAKMIESVRDIPRKFPGRGGTMFKKAFEQIKAHMYNEPVVVVLTDGAIGDLDSLPRPSVPVMWCIINGTDFVPPFGHKVDIVYK